MTDAEQVSQALAELWDTCDSTDAVQTVTDRIEQLTEQLAAARQDAKESEAYAEELEKELNTCRMAQAVMDNTVADLEAKLAKAVEALDHIAAEASVPVRTKKKGGIKHKWMYRGWRKIAVERIDIAIATLAEIKGDSHD